MKKLKILWQEVRADVVQADGVDGFACYLQGSARKNKRCIIGLNVEAFMAAIVSKQLDEKDIPYIMAESMMHEVIHAVEDWARVEFSHKKVNKLIDAYREHYYGQSRKTAGSFQNRKNGRISC